MGRRHPSLASELLAWYHFVAAGLSPERLARVMQNAADLLEDLYKDES